VSKAETGNRRLDVIELREWLLAMGADFLAFMTELHEQLESLDHIDPWLIGRQPLPSEIPSSSLGAPEASGSASDATRLPPAAELASLLSELERVRQLLQPNAERAVASALLDDVRGECGHDQAVNILGTYLLEQWVPDLIRQWRTHWNHN
jgi:hypothetical protein